MAKIINNVFCFFEQSGTFKNEFKKLGFKNAFDCDILDDFGQTDYKRDLFKDIEMAFDCLFNNKGELKNTIFDKIKEGDLIFAFFPCIKFTEKAFLFIRGMTGQWIRKDDDYKLYKSVEKFKDSFIFYELLCKLCRICLKLKIKLIIENPLAQPHFLTLLFPLKPQVIIKNRAERGDYYKKPTQFWFIGFEPSYNYIFENIEHKHRTIEMTNKKRQDELLKWFEDKHNLKIPNIQKARSMISPLFANRFIREFIL